MQVETEPDVTETAELEPAELEPVETELIETEPHSENGFRFVVSELLFNCCQSIIIQIFPSKTDLFKFWHFPSSYSTHTT